MYTSSTPRKNDRRERNRARAATSSGSGSSYCHRFRNARPKRGTGNRSKLSPEARWWFQWLLIRSRQGAAPQSRVRGPGKSTTTVIDLKCFGYYTHSLLGGCA